MDARPLYTFPHDLKELFCRKEIHEVHENKEARASRCPRDVKDARTFCAEAFKSLSYTLLCFICVDDNLLII